MNAISNIAKAEINLFEVGLLDLGCGYLFVMHNANKD